MACARLGCHAVPPVVAGSHPLCLCPPFALAMHPRRALQRIPLGAIQQRSSFLCPCPPQIDFRFFCGVVAWQPGDLEKDIAAGAWHTAACSRVLVLKQCLQLPTPLWREVMCLMGGQYAEQAREQQRLDEGSESQE